MPKSHYERFNEILNAIPLEELHKKDADQKARDNDDFERLKQGLLYGNCGYCGNPLHHFSVNKPCFHWLLAQAKGFKKSKHFQLIYNKYGYHQLEAYLRWVANTEVFMSNINDIKEEKSSDKFIETTIRYKNLEWSFSCSFNDLEGHSDRYEGATPHYHFQMKIDGNVTIGYNSFHLPFNDYDDFCFAVESGKFDRLKAGRMHGAGMQDLFENLTPEELINTSTRAENAEDAHLNMSSLVIADEGTTISGDDLAELFQERIRTGATMASLMRRLPNVSIQTTITPGDGVPEIAERTRHKKR